MTPINYGVKWLLAAALLCLVVAAPASAQGRDAIIEDCADDGSLSGDYSSGDLRDARQNLPSDVAEYTDCADVLRRAELGDGSGSNTSGSSAGGGAGGGTAGGGGSAGGGSSPLLTPSSPDEQKSLDNVRDGVASAIDVGGQSITPGASGFAPQAARNGLPGTLVAVLILLGGLAIAALVPFARRRLGGRSNGPGGGASPVGSH